MVVGEGQIASTAKYLIGWQGLVIGRDALSPVSWDYPHEFPFTGELESVKFDIDDDAEEVAYEVFD